MIRLFKSVGSSSLSVLQRLTLEAEGEILAVCSVYV